MSINCAIKQANIEDNTANADKPKTFEKTFSPTGDHDVAGVISATTTIKIEKKEAAIPVITTWFAFFLPQISEMMSVIKKVIGYGNKPTESSKENQPKGFQKKNFWKIRLDTTKDVIKSPANTK